MSAEAEATKQVKGPQPQFYFGNLKQIGPKSHLTFMKWNSDYGSICRVNLGPLGKGIILGDHVMLKKAFEENEEVFNGRFLVPVIKKSGDYGTLTWENGENWEKRRQLFHGIMEKLDLNKLAHDQATGFCDMLSKSQSKPPDTVYQLIYEASLNMSAAFCFRRSQQYEYDDPRFRQWVDLVTLNLASRHNLLAEPVNFIPFLWSTFMYTRFRQIGSNLDSFVKKELDERSGHAVEGSVKDLMDGYLANVAGIAFPPKDCVPNIVTVNAAIMTLKNAMLWLILLITKHREVQTKIQEEVTSALENNVPIMDDAVNLPYLNATVYETLRYACAATTAVPHMVQEDIEFEGYNIQKGTAVFGNIWGAHYDTKYWNEPEKFNPDRFLDNEGKLDVNKESYVPFGLGNRRCPGEGLALKAMFLFLANVYQRYGFEEIDGEPLPDVSDGILFAGVHQPPPYKLKIVSR